MEQIFPTSHQKITSMFTAKTANKNREIMLFINFLN